MASKKDALKARGYKGFDEFFNGSMTMVEDEEDLTADSNISENISITEEKTIEENSDKNNLVNISVNGKVINQTDLVPIDGRIYHGSYDIFSSYEDENLRLPLRNQEELDNLKNSIKMIGMTTPALCVERDGKLVLLSGHNRVEAVRQLNEEGFENIYVDYIIKTNLTKEEERLIVIDTNLESRQITEIKPSQLAYLLHEKRECEKHTKYGAGKRWTDGNKFKMGKSQIAKYIKIHELIPQFLEMVDNGKMLINVAYDIAFLANPQNGDKNLYTLYNYITDKKIKITAKESYQLKNNADKELTTDILDIIFSSNKQPKELVKEDTKKQIFGELVRRFFSDVTNEDAELFLEKILREYGNKTETDYESA